MENSIEVGMLIKTLPVLEEKLFSEIRRLHPYETPASFSWHSGKTDADYLVGSGVQVQIQPSIHKKEDSAV